MKLHVLSAHDPVPMVRLTLVDQSSLPEIIAQIALAEEGEVRQSNSVTASDLARHDIHVPPDHSFFDADSTEGYKTGDLILTIHDGSYLFQVIE